MKKLFTLALALSVAFVGYSQVQKVSRKDDVKKVATMQKATGMESFENVQSQPNMTRSDGELDYTYYDWQSNQGPRSWTIVWPDGKVNFAFTCATSSTFTDRGTAIGTYDAVNDEWIPSDGRVENEKTGFGSIARYGENGIVIAAHTATNTGIYIAEDKDNIVPNSLPAAIYTDNGSYTHPAVMTSGANRDIIHLFCGNFDDSTIPPLYWRSTNGQTWDKAEVILPFIEECGSDWGTNDYYWIETTEDNCLALVINSAWSDGIVLYSYDDGETWYKKEFYHHPGVHTTIGEEDWVMYPRWTSAQWSANGLSLAFEFNGTRGEPGAGSYFPSIGGVGFWAENMPYAGEGYAPNGYDPSNPMPPMTGKPFIMDSAYMFNDIYAAWPRWSDQTWNNPAYFGYVAPLDENGNWQSWEDATEFNIEDFSLHGSYNSGCAGMPVLCVVPGSNGYDMVTVWSSMDEHNTDDLGNYYYKLFASYSANAGNTWSTPVHLTNDFMYDYSECVYPQAAVIGTTLVVAAQMDGTTGTFVQNDDPDGSDNYYQGLTFELTDLFPGVNVGTVENKNVHMTLYPNPAVDHLNVTLSQNSNITVYNIMGQVIRTVEGHIGANQIDLSGMNAGVYFVSAGSDTQKFIVK
jgi:hypothetical protein